MKIEIRIPESAMPKKDPENPCECQFRPFQLKGKTSELFWLVDLGEEVKKDQIICEAEAEKKTVELKAPCDGKLVEVLVKDEEKAQTGDVIAYIETEES